MAVGRYDTARIPVAPAFIVFLMTYQRKNVCALTRSDTGERRFLCVYSRLGPLRDSAAGGWLLCIFTAQEAASVHSPPPSAVAETEDETTSLTEL
ncbi:hypothetical protein Taro_051747 [Colocasia esculenta]|uniref:Uncharacterized protein n=1 Tax=Colocasia esculenta TaxID=4460 RepID=A0A843XGS4_COLES|nr:hypothetical protein [Colocasia esculenta]